MERSLKAMLVETTPDLKRIQFMTALKSPRPVENVDLQSIKQRLRDERGFGIDILPGLVEQARQSLSSIAGCKVHWANDARSAADLVQELAGESKCLWINKSGTVNEIKANLESKGFFISDTYLNCSDNNSDNELLKNRFEYYWQLPETDYPLLEDKFNVSQRINLLGKSNLLPGNEISLIGVNALSAADGTPYFLQHSNNIGKLLRARKIILLVGLEKVVPTRVEAEFQTKWAGILGLNNMLLDISLPGYGVNTDNQANNLCELGNQLSEQQVDIIFLDNGRLQILDSAYKKLLYCLSCRSCLKRCPNYKYFGKQTGNYPQQYLFSFLTGQNKSVDLCARCGNCFTECPVGIDIPMMITQAKFEHCRANWTLGEKILANPEPLAKLSQVTAPLSGWALRQKITRFSLEKILGVHRERTLPGAEKTDISPTNQNMHHSANQKTVTFFRGCYASYFEPEVASAAVKVLEACGFSVIIPEMKCCGIPTLSLGDIDKVKQNAIYNVEKLLEPRCHDNTIVATCPSCGLALKHDYPALGIKGSEQVAGRVNDLQSFLWELHQSGDINLKFKPMEIKLLYHWPCHLRNQGAENKPLELLRLIPGLSIIENDRGCCGMSGTFGQKKKNFTYSLETGKPLFDSILESETDAVCTECGTCKLQILHGTSKQTVHPIVLLANNIIPQKDFMAKISK